MAKITISGDAVTVTSALKLEDLRTIKQYRPKALSLMGGEDNKEPIFGIGVTNGCGDINSFSVSFGRETHDDAKLAYVTMGIDDEIDGDIKEFVADRIGAVIMNLNKLEETLPTVLEEIKSERDKVLSNITVLQ